MDLTLLIQAGDKGAIKRAVTDLERAPALLRSLQLGSEHELQVVAAHVDPIDDEIADHELQRDWYRQGVAALVGTGLTELVELLNATHQEHLLDDQERRAAAAAKAKEAADLAALHELAYGKGTT